MAISFKPVFFISVYSTYIHLYFFIPLCQSRLMPISFYLFINLNSQLYLSNPFSLSQSILCISTCICFYLLSIYLYFFISLCQSRLMPISFYLFVNSNSRLYFSNPFSISQSILCISTYIYFYLLLIYLYFFIPLYQSILMPISFYLFVNPNSRLYLSMFFSLFQYIPHLFTSISFYLFINPNPRFSLSILFLYLYLFFVYQPIFVSISCLTTSIFLNLFINPG